MSDQISNTSSVDNRSLLLLPLSQGERILKQQQKTLDTLISIDVDEKSKKQKKQIAPQGTRPSLPAPKSSKTPDYLEVLTAAFSKMYSSMANSTASQTQDFANLQTLDYSMSQIVFTSTNNAITELGKEQAKAQKINHEIKEAEKKDKKWGEIMRWTAVAVMGVLIVATVASGFFDGGASDVAAPEEVGVEAGLVGSAEASGEAGGEAGAGVDEEPALETGGAYGEEGPNSIEMQDLSSQEAGPDEVQQAQTQSNSQTTDEANSSKSSWGRKIVKFLARVGLGVSVSAVLGSPMLIQAIQGFRLSKQQKELAETQASTGKDMSTLEANKIYYRNVQQLVQRAGNVLQEEGNNTTEVIQTYGDITSAYRQINTGLANAV